MSLSDKELLTVKSLDFKTIKSDLVAFLTSQEVFKDYNFQGSGMSVLLDILAYNTHHMGFYANMIANESFLDSCIIRNSAVSLAKSIGYTPKSRIGSEVVVDVEINLSSFTSAESIELRRRADTRLLRILKNELFSTRTFDSTYYFYSTETYFFSYDTASNKLISRNVVLREGRLKTVTFTVNERESNQRFVIEDTDLDERSVTVFVRKSLTESEGTNIPWIKSKSIVDNQSNSRVFFIQETYDGYYELYFGGDVLGRGVKQGNIIVVTYASSSGEEANGIGFDDSEDSPSFRYLRNQNDSITFTTTTKIQRDAEDRPILSYGGRERETLDSIKTYSPRLYESQDRAVTLNDYITLLQTNYSGAVKSVHAWGGEENDPPEYGKVFLAIRPTNSLFLSTQEKLSIQESILSQKNVVSITPTVIDPEYLFISPSVNVRYEPKILNISPTELNEIILDYIIIFGLENLSAFEKNFFSGQMVTNILNINSAIKSCTVEVSFKKIIEPIFNTKFVYSINFENPLIPLEEESYVVSSSFFTFGNSPNALNLPSVKCYFKDNGKGRLILYRESDDAIINRNFGNVNYETGKVNIRSVEILVNPNNLEKYQITVSAKPKENDVFSKRRTILELDRENINLTLRPISSTRI
jgi:hypothetical protein